MPRRCIAICCSLLLIEWLAGCSADDRLAWKPRPGADYRLLIDITDSDILRSGDTIFRIRHTYDLTLQLQRQEKNRYFMDVVINDILIEQPGRRVKLKSGDSIWLTGLGPEPPFSFSTKGVPPEVENNKDYKTELKEYYKEHLKLFSKLSGAKLQVVMDHKGQVKEVIGAEEFTKRIFAGIALDPNVAHGLLLFYEPGKFITELLNNAFFFLPGQKIEKDEQWCRYLQKVTRYTGLKYFHRMTATDILDDVVQLSVQSDITNWLGEEGQVGGEGEITGNVTVDPATGMPLKADLTQLYLLRMEDFMKDVVKKRTINIRNTP